MGSTRPRSVSSPVIAVSARAHLHHPKTFRRWHCRAHHVSDVQHSCIADHHSANAKGSFHNELYMLKLISTMRVSWQDDLPSTNVQKSTVELGQVSGSHTASV